MTTEGRSAEALAPATDDVERRLRELDHRFKNDLQLLTSIFLLQLRRTPQGPQREALEGALARVNAIAAVHRRIDARSDPEWLDAADLVRDLAAEAAAERPDVEVRLELSPTPIPGRQAAPLAVIAGELMRNGLKHAFVGRPGALDVSLSSSEAGVRLTVRDDGDGEGPTGPGRAGFGVTLVELLTRQLRGEVEFIDARPGVEAVVRFPAART